MLIVTTFVNTSGKCINQISTKSSLLGSQFLQHEPQYATSAVIGVDSGGRGQCGGNTLFAPK